MLVRVRDFGLARGDRFPKSTRGGEAFAAVDAAVNTLNQHAATEFSSSRSGSRGGASTDTAAYRALVEMVEAISLTGRAVALDTPGADDRFRVTKAQGRRGIMNAARAFARDAEPLASQFIAHGMPEDFVAQLKAKIAGFEQVLHEREARRELNASSRASMNAALESGLAAVQRLDAIVSNVLGVDAAAMASWAVARRIEHYGGTKRASTVPSVAAATGAAATLPSAGAALTPTAPQVTNA
jgi:hypothetical protein